MYSNVTLNNVANYSDKRINIKDVPLEDFVTTDNMLQNKLGITLAVKLPPQDGNMPMYNKGNILVANIRPYLKKIWFADREGGCSSDVLVFDIMDEYDPKFVYYALLRDDFFVHMMKGSKGTKMPRGDKTQIMDFVIPKIEIGEQLKIASILSTLDRKIELNNKIHQELEAMAKTIYDYWFVQFDFPDAEGKPYKSSGGKMMYSDELKRKIPQEWEIKEFGDISSIIAGGDKPKQFSDKKSKICDIPIFSNGITSDGLYGYTDKARIIKQSITISARGTIGYCVLRNTPFVPIIRLISVTPNYDGEAEFFYHSIKNLVFENSGSVQQQLTVPQISTLKIIFPTTNILEKFRKIISPVTKKRVMIKKENQKLTQLRDWLLPMLMNGQVKVS